MRKERKITIVSIILVFFFFLGGFAGIVTYSGHDPPFSVVISQSMQQNETESQLGSIDTGDMVFVRNKDRVEITTYIEDCHTGKKTFGDYGSVIIYNTPCKTKIIHRALMKIRVVFEDGEKFAVVEGLESYPSFILAENDSTEKITKDFYFTKENGENEI